MSLSDINQRTGYPQGKSWSPNSAQLDQNYHIDRHRRHNHLLHVAGISQGLTVTKGVEPLTVILTKGTGLTCLGQEVILLEDKSVELNDLFSAGKKDGDWIFMIQYHEDSNDSKIIQEKPVSKLIPSTESLPTDAVALAKLTIKDGQIQEPIDFSVREYSGLRLPTASGDALTLRSAGDNDSKKAILNGSLRVEGKLELLQGVAVKKFSSDVNFTENSEEAVPTEKAIKAYVDEKEKAIKTYTDNQLQSRLPAGTIIMWYSQDNKIPDGWQFCDGTNKTPDLRERFIVGANLQDKSEYAANKTGEPDTHNHSMQNQNIVTTHEGNHNHKFPSQWYVRTLDDLRKGGNRIESFELVTEVSIPGNISRRETINVLHHCTIDPGGYQPTIENQQTQNVDSHNHTINLKDVTTEKSQSPNRPKWYAICFIMKK
ncbi:hypothetical protein ACE1CD_23005 [Aerosakkonema sp. BLCC-F183]|uniref:hypothetical protein n=1 Tax=Aerosakkonema sp. BLCC-F183 TaxID=3342834 RepID=UPI0035BB7E9C